MATGRTNSGEVTITQSGGEVEVVMYNQEK